jgi:hypothetical protein
MNVKGGCLCGSFQFEVSEPFGIVRLCHCDLCRKANGSAFSANFRVPTAQVTIFSGADNVTEYQSSPGAWKAFCSTCGSPVYSRVEADPEGIRIRSGTLERTSTLVVTAHVWVGSKASWDHIRDDLPCFERGADGPRVAANSRSE